MKPTKLPCLAMLGAVLTFAATGCHTTPTKTTQLPNNPPPAHNLPGDPSMDPGMIVKPVENPGTTNMSGIPLPTNPHPGWIRHEDILKDKTVYFDFDKSAIKTGEESKLNEVAAYLKSNPGCAVLVEGNCDERGTEEYNRSLGERRALAAREYLVGQGIDAGRVDIITYGEDKPAVPGHDEAAWSKNRRDDFVVLTPP